MSLSNRAEEMLNKDKDGLYHDFLYGKMEGPGEELLNITRIERPDHTPRLILLNHRDNGVYVCLNTPSYTCDRAPWLYLCSLGGASCRSFVPHLWVMVSLHIY